jgi:adenosylcobinamide-GDP ribazoletransferase
MRAFVYGGSASGKSAVAEDLCCKLAASDARSRLVYVATMPDDGSAQARECIERHRSQRSGKGFVTWEITDDLEGALRRRTHSATHATRISSVSSKAPSALDSHATVLLEGLGTLAANELFGIDDEEAERSSDKAFERIAAGIEELAHACANLVIVSDDVFRGAHGQDLDERTREYLDLLARLNRTVAQSCDMVAEVVCGIPVWQRGEERAAGAKASAQEARMPVHPARDVIGAAALALSMFSRIPVKAHSLSSPSMRYALAFWPLVGVLEGVACLAWGWVCCLAGLARPLAAAVFTVLPFAVNGGLHADGLCDTADALASHADRERALQVMADPRAGSFAVLTLGCHLVLTLALFWCVPLDLAPIACIALSYVLSRAIAGITVARWPNAHPGGLADAFGSAASPSSLIALSVTAVACCAGMVAACGLGGALAVAAALAVLAWYRWSVARRLGGITGDTSGWFVQTSELAMLLAVVIGGLIA